MKCRVQIVERKMIFKITKIKGFNRVVFSHTEIIEEKNKTIIETIKSFN